MSVSIRELGMRDQMMLEELLDACTPGWHDALSPGASGPMAFIADSATFTFGAYVDNDPAGFVWGTHARCPDGRKTSTVSELHVLNGERRDELTSSLIEAAHALARRNGSSQLSLIHPTDAVENAALLDLGATPASDTGQTHYLWNL